MTLHNLKNYQF